METPASKGKHSQDVVPVFSEFYHKVDRGNHVVVSHLNCPCLSELPAESSILILEVAVSEAAFPVVLRLQANYFGGSHRMCLSGGPDETILWG